MRSGEFRYHQHERVVYGEPAAHAVASEAERSGAERLFIVTTRSLSGETGLAAGVAEALGPRHAGTYAGIKARSPIERVLEAADAARQAKADLIVAIGGGSVIDSAKAVTLCLWYDVTTPAELQKHRGTQDADPSRRPRDLVNPIRVLAVPTTLSGSEFTSNAGLQDSVTGTKVIHRHALLTPQTIVLDPAFTLQTPLPHLLSTGVKGIDHAVEFLCSARIDPYSAATCREALGLLYAGLLGIKAAPENLDHRQDSQLGVWLAMTALSTRGVGGASHAIGHVLGGSYGISHGITSCVTLPAVLRWNAPASKTMQRKLSAIIGKPETQPGQLVEDLVKSLELPHRLRDIGIAHSEFPAIAAQAMKGHMMQFNPRPVTGSRDVVEILELAW